MQHWTASKKPATVQIILKDSNNLFASRIFLALGNYGWTSAAEIITKQISHYATPVLIDGSGLSRLNQASANDINKLLVNIVKDNYNFDAFFESLAILGYDGTLKYVIVDLNQNQTIVGKTGSMAGVDAIAGFIVINGSPRFAYTLILNGRIENKNLRLKARNDWLVSLARYASKFS